MTDSSPPAPETPADATPAHDTLDEGLAFVPVACSPRRDGWTPDRQRRFIAALAVMGVVARAARAVGMSATAAYKLRARPDAADFASAWDCAIEQGRERAYAIAVDRAINGITVPRFYKGKQVATVHRYDYRLLTAALMAPAAPPRRGKAPQ